MHAAEVVVLIISVAPLLVRRIWPLPVFGLDSAHRHRRGIVDEERDRRPGPAHRPVYRGVDAAAAGRAGLRGLLEVVAVIALLLYADSRWWFDAIFVSGMVAAALGLGLYFAARRAYLAELHDRAERLERERDQQAALAAAAERARIAREMHDIVAHHLTVMTTLAEAAVAASASSPEKATDVMRSVAATGRRALADTRRLLGVLRERPGQDERRRGPAAGTRSQPAGRPDRAGPFGWTGHRTGTARAGTGRARGRTARGVPAGAGGPHQHAQARRGRRPRFRAAELRAWRAARRRRR